MKKTGFTLAEVLVTVAIIGVVITLTLPSLLHKEQSDIVDNTKINKSYTFQDRNCKTVAIEINQTGLIVRCRDF